MTEPVRILPTLWDGDGIENAWLQTQDLLRALEPPALQLHTTDPLRVTTRVRLALPRAQLVIGVGIDWIARDVAQSRQPVTWGLRRFEDLAQRAADAGAVAIMWNAEGGWKTPPTGEARRRLHEVATQGTAQVAQRFPELAQWLTSYDHPTYHSTFNWSDWIGRNSKVTRVFPQVYAAPGDGLLAHRGALPRREARALASWQAAVRAGWIQPDAPAGTPEDAADVDWCPYYQLHSVTMTDTVQSSLRHLGDPQDAAGRTVSFWALRSRSDRDGRRALAGIIALDRLGYRGPDAVRRFQTEHPACGDADDVYGPKTESVVLREAHLSVPML